MAISMDFSFNPNRLVATTTKLGFRRMKVQAVSCRVDDFAAAERGKTNFYKVLSLDSENVGLAEIKKSYRRMVLRYHPDVCSPSSQEESTQRFLELQMAYETLSDPISRQMYDYELSLVNPIGFGFGNYTMNERSRSNVQRDVKKRSNVTRMQRMKNR
ncbi:Slufate transporter 2,1 [Hibiscus syriacus]|uniref:Slufate transporter 2,1 n=1 Tax=Hibiscus syriacus TaxID=106335 RepID=A0A6A2WW66_HIBSY|nr:chaperone protein dnaJ 20, chloroplastic-like [Hibiscus syriacus]KAE8665982.1 Slufate transporter 2,1 [Hibiscus syriacus]